ncbi:IS5 family transposase [Aeromonas encheleia]|uniref:IS5 family transposase n=1 Tax=Aeromonas encheleia TaxID=73010 RepID=UPI001F58C3BA|nr:IS5 family transposase [Aeromonas encheleia]UNP88097.1 IS5 family transposase [Aeromonas encheleia]
MTIPAHRRHYISDHAWTLLGWAKRGLNSKIHLEVDAHGMPRCIVTSGTAADGTQASALIEGLKAAYLLADRGDDTNALIAQAASRRMVVVIPSKRNSKEQREHDREIYKARHRVEKVFLHLKQWRGIATRYAQNAASFVAIVPLSCAPLWAAIL